MAHDDNNDILRVSDVAEFLNVATRTIQLWAECGRLRAFKLGRGWRFRREDIKNFLQSEQERDPE